MSEELFEALNQPQEEIELIRKELQGKYCHVLTSTDMGVDVLSDILVSFCHFGCFLETDYERAQHNVGVNILSRCGIFTPGNMQTVVRALANAIPKKEE